jgi:Helix-turn-helix domain
MATDPLLSLHFDPQVLRPIIEAVVTATVAQLEADRRQLPENGRLAFSEEEAARMLGLESHQLRDERRRGRIGASSIVGRRIRYTRQDLLAYLSARHVNASQFDGHQERG